MPRLISWSISLDMDDGGFMEIPDGTPDSEIDKIVQEIAFNGLDWGWADTVKTCASCKNRRECQPLNLNSVCERWEFDDD